MYIGYQYIVLYMDIQCITMLYHTIKLYKWIYHIAYHHITRCWAKVISSRSCLKFVEKEFIHAGHTLCLGCLGYRKPSGAGLWCVSSMWLQADTFPQNDIEWIPTVSAKDIRRFPQYFAIRCHGPQDVPDVPGIVPPWVPNLHFFWIFFDQFWTGNHEARRLGKKTWRTNKYPSRIINK